MKQNKKLIILLFFLTFFPSLFADNFRVAKINIIEFNEKFEASSSNIGLNEAVYIKIPEDKTFLEGLEIEIKIPTIVATYRDSVIYSFYKNTTPEPKSNIIDYKGEKIFSDVIPPRLSVNFQVFLDEISQPKSSPYSTLLPFSISKNQDSLVVRFQLAMKGVPESFFDSEFIVNVKPILKNQGLLDINLIYPETKLPTNTSSLETIPEQEEIENQDNNKISLFIDENIIEDFSKPILLKTGVHHVSVITENYRNEVRTIVINQASTTNLEIELKSIEPELILIAPYNAVVFLNDIEIKEINNPIVVSPGEHVVKFLIGDYEVSKKISIQNGKSYVVSLSVDIEIEEKTSN